MVGQDPRRPHAHFDLARVTARGGRRLARISLKQPAFGQIRVGQIRVANEMRKLGFSISQAGVRGVWLRHDLETMKKTRAATSGEVKELRREARALKEVVAEQALELRLLKKSMIADGGSEE